MIWLIGSPLAGEPVLKGHDFSRADQTNKITGL